jgi:molybdopterin-guanine dinucleotide biosynthesis protein B
MQNRKPFIIGITGRKKSGKTTLIELLAKKLSAQGLIVGTIKNTTHKVEFDTPGKDTYRHRRAGAAITLIRSAKEVAMFTDSDYLNQRLLWIVFEECDIVMVEGDSKSAFPKIYVAGASPPRTDIAGPVVATWGGNEQQEGIRNYETGQIDDLCRFLVDLAKGN